MSLKDKPVKDMTLHEHYVGLAMQGLLVNLSISKDDSTTNEEAVAILSVGYADAVIAELEKSNG